MAEALGLRPLFVDVGAGCCSVLHRRRRALRSLGGGLRLGVVGRLRGFGVFALPCAVASTYSFGRGIRLIRLGWSPAEDKNMAVDMALQH